jgi:hypothetical protein
LNAYFFQIVLLDVVLEQLIPGLAQEALLRPPPRAALLLLRPLRPGLHSQLQDRQKQGPGGAQVSREQKTEHCPETVSDEGKCRIHHRNSSVFGNVHWRRDADINLDHISHITMMMII